MTVYSCHCDRESLCNIYMLFFLSFPFSVVLLSGRVLYKDMYDMLKNIEPPVGFGRNCPYRIAYKVSKRDWIILWDIKNTMSFCRQHRRTLQEL